MRNQFSNRQPFCDYLERYQEAHKSGWAKSHYQTLRVGLGRFDEWLKVTNYQLSEINWQKLLEFYRFFNTQGISVRAARKTVQAAKRALRWGIETGELPQKMEDIYTSSYSQNKWPSKLTPECNRYLERMEATRPGAFRAHGYSQRIFHTFLEEHKLSYRQLRPEHLVKFIKYLNVKDLYLRTKGSTQLHVKSYLHWLNKEKIIKHKANDLVPIETMIKRPTSLPRPLDPELDQELQNLLITTKDQLYQAILLIRRTGLRVAETLKLEFDCVEYDIKQRASLKVPAVKLGSERRVPLDEQTIKIVQYLQETATKNNKKKLPPKFLMINSKGRQLKYAHFSDALTEICARLKAKKWINLHSLRHTYATSLLSAGLSITSLKELLGHKSIVMSLMYAKVTPEKVHKEYNKALEHMNKQQIPHLLLTRENSLTDSFMEIHRLLTKASDNTDNKQEKNEIKRILNRLSKIKTEIKNLPTMAGKN